MLSDLINLSSVALIRKQFSMHEVESLSGILVSILKKFLKSKKYVGKFRKLNREENKKKKKTKTPTASFLQNLKGIIPVFFKEKCRSGNIQNPKSSIEYRTQNPFLFPNLLISVRVSGYPPSLIHIKMK